MTPFSLLTSTRSPDPATKNFASGTVTSWECILYILNGLKKLKGLKIIRIKEMKGKKKLKGLKEVNRLKITGIKEMKGTKKLKGLKKLNRLKIIGIKEMKGKKKFKGLKEVNSLK